MYKYANIEYYGYWIKIKKVIATFYLTILTFILRIAWYKLAIVS